MTLDVVVIGGGPAGASTAFQLARHGIRVRVLERARFPRPKPCAECLSPQATRLLVDMGALDQLERRGAWLRGMTIRAPDGTVARGDYEASHGFRAPRAAGLAIRRDVLDAALLWRARDVGAEVVEGVRAVDVRVNSRGDVVGAVVLRENGTREDISARVVVGADGLRSIVARRLRLARMHAWPRRISLVAHYRDVAGVTDYGEMHIERDGFVGIADVGDGITTVAAVFPVRRAKEIAGNRAGFLDAWLTSKPQLATRFAHATHHGGVSAVGPFVSHARRAWSPGALLVGDAADFFDPFTGEGIYAALRGGELASDAIRNALETERTNPESLMAYDEARRREFGGKWWVERLIGVGVAFAPVANRAARALASQKALADLLVGVTGDFVPPSRVLNASYLAKLFLLPTPRQPRTTWH
jgi:geranylgeranyl reductase family protein